MKKIIPFILSLFILLPGCSNDDTIKIPEKEITKEKANEIFQEICKKVDEVYENIKSGEESFFWSRVATEKSAVYKMELSIDNETKQSIEVSFINNNYHSGYYYNFNVSEETLYSYSIQDEIIKKYYGMDINKEHSAAFSWKIIVDNKALYYKGEMIKTTGLSSSFIDENTKFYSSKKGELYIDYSSPYDIDYKFYFKNYLPVLYKEIHRNKDKIVKTTFKNKAIINPPDVSNYTIVETN
jgi:NMD protein affecting ribosome stability and mRNA decay